MEIDKPLNLFIIQYPPRSFLHRGIQIKIVSNGLFINMAIHLNNNFEHFIENLQIWLHCQNISP